MWGEWVTAQHTAQTHTGAGKTLVPLIKLPLFLLICWHSASLVCIYSCLNAFGDSSSSTLASHSAAHELMFEHQWLLQSCNEDAGSNSHGALEPGAWTPQARWADEVGTLLLDSTRTFSAAGKINSGFPSRSAKPHHTLLYSFYLSLSLAARVGSSPESQRGWMVSPWECTLLTPTLLFSSLKLGAICSQQAPRCQAGTFQSVRGDNSCPCH